MKAVECPECGDNAGISYEYVYVDTIEREVPNFQACVACGARVSGWNDSGDGPPDITNMISASQARSSEREYRRQRMSREYAQAHRR